MSIHQPAIDIIRDERDRSQQNADRLILNVQRRMESIASGRHEEDYTPNNLSFLQRVIAEAEQQRDAAVARTASLNGTLKRLRAEAAGAGTQTQAPDAAEGQRAPRTHKHAKGDRVRSTSGGSFYDEVGTIEVLQPMGKMHHPLSVPWYEVRFPNNALITISEGNLAPV